MCFRKLKNTKDMVSKMKIARMKDARVLAMAVSGHRGEDSQDWKDARVLAMAVSGHRGEDSQDWKDARVLAVAVSVAGLFQSAIVQS